MTLRPLVIATACICLAACSPASETNGNAATPAETTAQPDAPAEVTTLILRASDFDYTVTGNGKISARAIAGVYAPAAETVVRIAVRNGQHVSAGQEIARLDSRKYESEKKRLALALEKASLDMQDILISQGYDPADQSRIPAEISRLASVQSGYGQAREAYAAACASLDDMVVRAPIAGVVADLEIRPSDRPDMSKPICRIIDNSALDIQFPVLESELGIVTPGAKVEVRPFASDISVQGTVTEINPSIDDNGHINIKARLDGAAGLIDGMNARVYAHKRLGERLVVPKSAPVLRSGRQVVFTRAGDVAHWNYVTIGLENESGYTIEEGLKEGDEIIIGGNATLAHNSPVKVVGK